MTSFLRKVLRWCGQDRISAHRSLNWSELRSEVADLRAFRIAAESEITRLKEQTLVDRDKLGVQQDYLKTLQVLLSNREKRHDIFSPAFEPGNDSASLPNGKQSVATRFSEGFYPSCRWIEGGLSFVPGHVRVCPNCNAEGGAPGLISLPENSLPMEEILAKKSIIREGNSVDAFDPCTNCSYREVKQWPARDFSLDILCISHATACNLACNYCHTVPEENYLQNPNQVPTLYQKIEQLILDGHLSPNSLIQWGGGEPTILKEFRELFQLLEVHGAYSEVYTSGVRVSEVLLEALGRNTAGVMVSLDAGSAQTYAQIKGRPAFDRVVASVRRYASVNPGRTILKMILFEQNLNEVSQFLDIAERAGVQIVCFDTPLYVEHIDSRFIDAAAFFCDEAGRRGLEWRPGEVGLVFNPQDRVSERVAERRQLN